MNGKPKESDWKTFRNRVPEWRERYLRGVNQRLVGMLTDPNRSPTERFWDTKQKMKEEAQVLTKCLDGHSRSNMDWFLMLMLRHGLVTEDDLTEFSEELKERVVSMVRG